MACPPKNARCTLDGLCEEGVVSGGSIMYIFQPYFQPFFPSCRRSRRPKPMATIESKY